MNSFDKFVALYRVDSRYVAEMAQGFVWYHCRAAGVKSIGIQTILEYYKAAGVSGPSAPDLDKALRSDHTGIVTVREKFRVSQPSESWFADKFEPQVFHSGLPIFLVERRWTGRFVHRCFATAKPAVLSGQPARLHNVIYWAKEHPAAAWLSMLLAVAGILLAIWPPTK